ncbi:MAG: DUF4386 domain-containing protein [Candidatus Eremiobacteraeota bacterium]|nr:DUF4386 domain-containing protein [Candidatus Eremiobacteraeota bacterium]
MTSSPTAIARIAGFFYLLTFLAGIPLFFVRKLIVSGDAAATAANVLSHQAVFWWGFGSQLVVVASYVVVTALLYEVFKPAGRALSLVAAFFSLMGCATQIAATFFYLAVFTVLQASNSANPVYATASQAVAGLFLKLYTQSYDVGLVFFGFYCLLIGCLIFRGTFVPKIFGLLMAIAGIGWLTFLVPPFATTLYPAILLPGLVGEGALTIWLLAAGVNAERWAEQALTRT